MPDKLRARITDLYAAYARGHIGFVLNAVDDDIDFVSYGPAEYCPYLGHHVGKAAFAETMKTAHASFEFLTYKPARVIVENSNAAAILSVRLRQHGQERIIHLFVAHFMRFRDGRLFELREFMDTFDALQQMLGHEIDPHQRK